MADRNTPFRDGKFANCLLAADTVVYAGHMVVAMDTEGFVDIPGTSIPGVIMGVAQAFVDNTGGADGDKSVVVRRGPHKFLNDDTNPVTEADIGLPVYAVDGESVSTLATDRVAAGYLEEIDADGGVWVNVVGHHIALPA